MNDRLFIGTETETGWTRYTDCKCGTHWTSPPDDAPDWCPGCGRALFEESESA